MTVIPFRVVSFDDAMTSAMGEAFDRARKSLQNFGTAASAIIADRIIEAAKNGERDPARLYEQVLKAYDIDDTSMLVASVRHRSAAQRDLREPVWQGHQNTYALLQVFSPQEAVAQK
jgi:hypothetical protein